MMQKELIPYLLFCFFDFPDTVQMEGWVDEQSIKQIMKVQMFKILQKF